MAPSKQVIDLVSSDEEEVEWKGSAVNPAKRKKMQSISAGFKDGPTNQTTNKKKTRQHNPARQASFPDPRDQTLNPAMKKIADTNLNQVVFDDAINDNAIITHGALELLSRMVPSDSFLCTGGGQERNQGRRSTICHIKQNDKWSCGFRNMQMLLSSMIPHMPANHSFFHTIPRRDPNPAIPSLRQLQSALESSWKAGFDPVGARHFKHKVVGKASKIGAVEVSSVLAYCGVDSTVVQFIKCRESRELLPKFVRAYFSKSVGLDGCPFCSTSQLSSDACSKELLQLAGAGIEIEPACDCPLFPLYLQWEGHSVSLVGIENNDNFIVLDPLMDGSQMKSDLQNGKIPKRLRMTSQSLAHKDTQIVMCSFRSLTHREKENRMTEPSAITAAIKAVERVLLLESRGRR